MQLQVKFSRKICLDLPKVNDFESMILRHGFEGRFDYVLIWATR